MEITIQQQLTEAGLCLRKAIERLVNETPECFMRKNGKWCVEFRNPISGECIAVSYSPPIKNGPDEKINT